MAASTLPGTASERVKSMPTTQSRGRAVSRPTTTSSWPRSRRTASTSWPILPWPTRATFTRFRSRKQAPVLQQLGVEDRRPGGAADGVVDEDLQLEVEEAVLADTPHGHRHARLAVAVEA